MPKISTCCIVGCTSISKDSKKFSSGKKNSPKYNHFLSMCFQSSSNIEALSKPVICVLHFKKVFIGLKKLYPEAFPSLNLSCPAESLIVNFPSTFEVQKNEAQSSEDLSFEEFEQFSDNAYYTPKNDTNIPDMNCGECEQSAKNCLWYKEMHLKTLKAYEKCTNEVKVLRKIIMQQKRKIYKLNKKITGNTFGIPKTKT